MKKNKLKLFILLSLFSPIITIAKEMKTLETIYNALIGIGGAITLLGLIVAGIKFLTSAGEPSKIGEAKDWLKSAIIGGIIVAAASSLFYITTGKNPVWNITHTPLTTMPKQEKLPGVYLCESVDPKMKTECPFTNNLPNQQFLF